MRGVKVYIEKNNVVVMFACEGDDAECIATSKRMQDKLLSLGVDLKDNSYHDSKGHHFLDPDEDVEEERRQSIREAEEKDWMDFWGIH